MLTEQNQTVSRWQRIALPASLILNLFLVAVIGGHWWQTHRNAASGRMSVTRALRHAEAIMAPQDAAVFGAVMRRDEPRYMDAVRQLREARQQLWADITADRFDKDEVARGLAAWQTAYDGFLHDISGPLVEALGQVSADGRRKLIAERRVARDAFPRLQN